MSKWYELEDAGDCWWAVEHNGHPAFYLRALMAGDFAPGQLPKERHVITLDGSNPENPPRCGTCAAEPKSEDLEPIEIVSHETGHLDVFRRRAVPWPKPTDEGTCWLCSNKLESADRIVRVGLGRRRLFKDRERAEKTANRRAKVCAPCAKNLEWRRDTDGLDHS